jgi:hypothetical protein
VFGLRRREQGGRGGLQIQQHRAQDEAAALWRERSKYGFDGHRHGRAVYTDPLGPRGSRPESRVGARS